MSIRKQKSEVRSQKSDKKNSELQTPNSKLFFVLGGARSGKSAYALKMAESMAGKKLYLATAQALDREMGERIKKHKKQRGNNWTTIEEPIRIADVIIKNNPPSPPFGDRFQICPQGQGGFNVILLDCLTLWISNLMNKESRVRSQKSEVIDKTINQFVSACKKTKANIIVVSNEVGLGIVPDNSLARRFRDIAGIANQKIAAVADEVYFVAAGLPMRMK